jgi:hypothetical protein
MDPDMVRQQAEAEREALALLRKKPAAPTPASAAAVPPAVLTAAVQEAPPALRDAAASQTSEAGLTAGAVLQAPSLPEVQPPEQQATAPVSPRQGSSIAEQAGRFISFGVAGAMLGGGLGIVAADYMELPANLAKLAIFGPAAFFAGVCAVASFYTKASHE